VDPIDGTTNYMRGGSRGPTSGRTRQERPKEHRWIKPCCC
jgi:hypothetical protein